MKNAFTFVTITFMLLYCIAAGTGYSYGQSAQQTSQEEIQKLVVLLGDDDPQVRDQATKKLIEIGEPARQAVEKAVNSDDPEVSWRANKILESIRPQDTRIQGQHAEKPQQEQEGRIRISPDIRIQSNNYSLTKDSSGRITLSVTEKDENGKPAIKTYQADSVEEFIKKYPEVAEQYGINEDSFGNNNFSFRFKQEFDEDIDDIMKDFRERFKFNGRDFDDMDEMLDDFFKNFDHNFRDLDDAFKRYKSLRDEWEDLHKNKPAEPGPHAQKPKRMPAPAPQTPAKLCTDLGAVFSAMDQDTAERLGTGSSNGILVTGVRKNGVAEKTGLRDNDVITEVNGQEVNSYLEFRRLLCENTAMETAEFTIIRNGKTQTVTVKMELLMEY